MQPQEPRERSSRKILNAANGWHPFRKFVRVDQQHPTEATGMLHHGVTPGTVVDIQQVGALTVKASLNESLAPSFAKMVLLGDRHATNAIAKQLSCWHCGCEVKCC